MNEDTYNITIKRENKTDFYINAAGARIAPELIEILIMRSGLQWEMHPAQVFSLEMQALNNVTVLKGESKEVDVQKMRELLPETKHTLMGIPIILKSYYPMNLIRLMFNGEEVTRIEALAVPCGFCNYADYDKHCKDEQEKLAKIGYRSSLDNCQITS